MTENPAQWGGLCKDDAQAAFPSRKGCSPGRVSISSTTKKGTGLVRCAASKMSQNQCESGSSRSTQLPAAARDRTGAELLTRIISYLHGYRFLRAEL